MTRIVVEIKEDRAINVYTDQDAEVVVVDWKEVQEDSDTPAEWAKRAKEAEKELLHKTTGLKQVY